MSRANFMLNLYERLAYRWLEHRYALPNQHRNIREKIRLLLESIRPTIPRHGRRGSLPQGVPAPQNPAQPTDRAQSASSLAKRGYCQECDYKLRRKSSKCCTKCFKVLCGEHQVIVCSDCTKNVET